MDLRESVTSFVCTGTYIKIIHYRMKSNNFKVHLYNNPSLKSLLKPYGKVGIKTNMDIRRSNHFRMINANHRLNNNNLFIIIKSMTQTVLAAKSLRPILYHLS